MSRYDTSGVLPVESLDPGTQLLVTSPPLLGARAMGDAFLAAGLDDGEAAIAVSTDRGADRVVAGVREAATTDDAASRLGVVDCSGGESGADTRAAVARVGSAADLTGVGMAISELVEDLGADRLRFCLDSVSTLLVYSDVERVFRFVHALAGRLRGVDACSLFLLNADTDESAVDTFQGLADGRVEIRERDREVEYRVRRLPGADETWRPFDVDASTARGEGAAAPTATPEFDVAVESLHDLIEQMAEERLTLTVFNPVGDESRLETVTDYFERLQVATRAVDLPTETPTNLAVLHRGPETLATNQVETLHDWVGVESLAPGGGETIDRAANLTRPETVERATRAEYTVENAGKLRMVRISRLVELRALEAGAGSLHAGFQRLDRLDDELDTRRLYERVAATGVDVHIYGQPGRVPNEDAYTLHAGDSPELADSWFVVFDGGPTPDAAGALVSEETAPERYSGFWTYRPDVTRAAVDYLERTY